MHYLIISLIPSKNKIIKLLLIFIFLSISIKCHARPEQKRYIFIDGGAHYGESLKKFQETKLFNQFPWEIFAIEANPHLIENLKKIPDITVLNKAMWIKDGFIKFNLAENDGLSSVLYDSHMDKSATITVASIDFGQWLKRNFSATDYVIVSLDIEGGEYEILDKMLIDGTIKYVDRFYIEFHGSMFEQYRKKDEEMVEKLKSVGVLAGVDSVEHMVERGGWIDHIE